MGRSAIPEETPNGDSALRPDLSPMISYAQNFEDVMLRRALQDVERGFYVDLGAFHPEIDNVTRWFYGQGWTGVNVEPNPVFFELLMEQRPHDVNLPFAVADVPGTVQLHLLDGLSTIVEEIGQRHHGEAFDGGAVADVEAVTLDRILGEWANGRTVDFLKVDVEGAEAAVLNACAFRDCRPRILLIEATEPNSTRSTEATWEPQLLSKGYLFAYFDGLNRFYVRQEDAWRAEFLRVPPNVFDRFLLPLADGRVDLAGARRGLDPAMPIGGVPGLLAQRDDLAAQLDGFKARASEAEAQIIRLQVQLEASSRHAARLEARIAELEAELRALDQRAEQTAAELSAMRQQTEQAEARIVELEAERDGQSLDVAQLNQKSRKASRELDELRLQLEQERATVSAIRASRSWRITAPIRRLKGG